MKNTVEKTIPKSIKDFSSWQVSRRSFLRNALAVGALSQVAFLESCADKNSKTILSDKQLNLIISVQNILFPQDKNGPGAADFHADKYLLWVLSDERIAQGDKQYVLAGIKWVNESAEETHSKKYLQLTKKDQVSLVQTISKTNWGESWLSVILTFIFEAMISDPIYGFNTEEVGWKWLEHSVGLPRASQLLKYDDIFTTVQNKQYG